MGERTYRRPSCRLRDCDLIDAWVAAHRALAAIEVQGLTTVLSLYRAPRRAENGLQGEPARCNRESPAAANDDDVLPGS